MLTTIVVVSQLCLTMVMLFYFIIQIKSRYAPRNALDKDCTRELERLKKLNDIHLTPPLTEKTRPQKVSEIIGQEEGLKALRCALCGKNPQHILIYGPPGVGKTAASRVILNEARRNPDSPFGERSKFVEMDATTLQYDERSIADPLIGSVHDPIYQGAGAYGPAGVPQPKEGAVTKAHGGVLFIDEIGELPSVQMNKLLKVLEDRRVYFDSAYYSCENKDIPSHIHQMFQKGLPADFRLIGATTRLPEEIPPALRSRCVEIFFHSLTCDEIKKIAADAAKKTGMEFEPGVFDLVAAYADNGRDAVNIIQSAQAVAALENRASVDVGDAEWAIETGRYSPRYMRQLAEDKTIGRVSGVAVVGGNQGCILDVEAVAESCSEGCGRVNLTGAVEEEEISGNRRKLKRKSSVFASVQNVMTVMNTLTDIRVRDYNIHINFPCSVPVDGPSAGIAVFCAVYSAIKEIPIDERVVMTGELSISGQVRGVGEVPLKIRTALESGAVKIIIPGDNRQKNFSRFSDKIICVDNIFQVISVITEGNFREYDRFIAKKSCNNGIISAEGVEIFKKK